MPIFVNISSCSTECFLIAMDYYLRLQHGSAGWGSGRAGFSVGVGVMGSRQKGCYEAEEGGGGEEK